MHLNAKKTLLFNYLWVTICPMKNRKDQIHAALYNAAIDGGFMLTAISSTATGNRVTKIVATDLLEDTPDFEITFTGKDISDVDVEIDNGVRMGA
mgnify:CR=1 FL=1